jgi:hypothetical protein
MLQKTIPVTGTEKPPCLWATADAAAVKDLMAVFFFISG